METDHLLFTAPVPEAKSNAWALALGGTLQRRALTLPILSLGCLMLGTALAQYIGGHALDWTLSSFACLTGGLFTLTLQWVVINSPYKMLQVLRRTITEMQAVGSSLVEHCQRLDTTNTDLQRTNSDLQATQRQLEQQVHNLHLAAAGFQQTATSLMRSLDGSEMRLSTSIQALVKEMAELDLRAGVGRLMDVFSGMEEARRRNEELSAQLEQVSQTNLELSRRLKEELFDDAILRLIVQLDFLGDEGLTPRLREHATVTLTSVEQRHLLSILEATNRVLSQQQQH